MCFSQRRKQVLRRRRCCLIAEGSSGAIAEGSRRGYSWVFCYCRRPLQETPTDLKQTWSRACVKTEIVGFGRHCVRSLFFRGLELRRDFAEVTGHSRFWAPKPLFFTEGEAFASHQRQKFCPAPKPVTVAVIVKGLNRSLFAARLLLEY